jgi:aminopeptidase
MQDPRVRKFARLLAHYSIHAKKGETIGVEGPDTAAPLILDLYEELLRAGAFPIIRMTPVGATEVFFKHGQPMHFDSVPRFEMAYARSVDGTVRIMGSSNTRALSATDPERMARFAKARRPVRRILLAKKWSLTLFPTEAYAMDAEMSLAEFSDFVFRANLLHLDDPAAGWREEERKQKRLIARLKSADEIRIVGPDTDIRMSVKGRTFIPSVATHNVPSGEIFTGPIEDSVEGHIRYDFPVCEGGREIDGIRLVFRAGRVVEASAEKNEEYLLKMLDMDPGARRLGELGIGTNYDIQRFIKNILFDEKIGGTVHLALGESYAETGGKNKSGLHWDMIKDLRKGGAIYVDGKLFQRDGKFV